MEIAKIVLIGKKEEVESLAKENNIIYINIDNNNYYLKNVYSYPTTTGYKEISNLIIKAIDLTMN